MKKGTRILLLFLVLVLSFMVNCAFLLEREVEITGTARLSDNPAGGHAGILVSTDSKSTTTDKSGNFSLKGIILGETKLTLILSKKGYQTQYKEVTATYPKKNDSSTDPDAVIDVGTIYLTKLP
ncbi:MAG: carboxypeptidase-like regulatory domain-containing protein [Candidatus Zixiibacteriota bacterium]